MINDINEQEIDEITDYIYGKFNTLEEITIDDINLIDKENLDIFTCNFINQVIAFKRNLLNVLITINKEDFIKVIYYLSEHKNDLWY